MISELSTVPWEPAPAQAKAGIASATLLERLRAFQRPESVLSMPVQPRQSDLGLEEQLFNSQARSCRLVSALSMHLSDDWRQSVLTQLRGLLSFEDWDDDCNLLDEASTQSFLRFVIFGNVRLKPTLGISNRRRLTATWNWGDRRVVLEFSAADKCRCVFNYPGEFERVRQAFDGNIGDAVGILAGYGFDFQSPEPPAQAHGS